MLHVVSEFDVTTGAWRAFYGLDQEAKDHYNTRQLQGSSGLAVSSSVRFCFCLYVCKPSTNFMQNSFLSRGILVGAFHFLVCDVCT